MRSGPPATPLAPVAEEDYARAKQRILDRIAQLKQTDSSLRTMTDPSWHRYNVEWVLEDPTQPRSKINQLRPVYGPRGYFFSLEFYRGEWHGQISFKPIEFGDLKLHVRFGHAGNSSVIDAVTAIIEEEHKAFCASHLPQGPGAHR